MYTRLHSFFENYNILYSLQFRFGAKHSKVHTLIGKYD